MSLRKIFMVLLFPMAPKSIQRRMKRPGMHPLKMIMFLFQSLGKREENYFLSTVYVNVDSMEDEMRLEIDSNCSARAICIVNVQI